MRYEVLLIESAEHDLEVIYDYLVANGSREEADHVLDRVMVAAESLASFPDRGSHPKELAALGILDFRQVFFKPYRLIYRIMGRRVVISLVADGRREMQTLLANRLLTREPGSYS
jgi:toxin ParE1/3/4